MTTTPAMTNNSGANKVAVVTGANRGIGFQIVKNLCQQLDSHYQVWLTSRNEQRGQQAVQQIPTRISQASVRFRQLDIDNHQSIQNLCIDLKNIHGGCDILVQNAAIYLRNSRAPSHEIAETTLKTNYWGARDLCRSMLPVMRQNGRIVLLASRMGTLELVKCAETRRRLFGDDLTLDELDKLMESYVEQVKVHKGGPVDVNESEIWDDIAFKQPAGAYAVSKVGVIALARVLQREVDRVMPDKHVLIISCCPGYVATDMTNHEGEKTVEDGADTPTYLAVLNNNDADSLKGQFLGDRQVIHWETD